MARAVELTADSEGGCRGIVVAWGMGEGGGTLALSASDVSACRDRGLSSGAE
jgi:hypothetical protein